MNETSTRVNSEHRTLTPFACVRCTSTARTDLALRQWIAGLALACFVVGCAEQAAYPYPPPPPPPPPPAVEPAPLPEPYTQAAPPGAPPASLADAGASPASPSASSSPYVYSYANGQWVYVVDEGWVWIPSGATTVEMEGIPYVFLYTPVLGWTWYVSPWGRGPYVYGPWFRHPWHPYGWHGYWVAHPHVIERLGPRGGAGRR